MEILFNKEGYNKEFDLYKSRYYAEKDMNKEDIIYTDPGTGYKKIMKNEIIKIIVRERKEGNEKYKKNEYYRIITIDTKYIL